MCGERRTGALMISGHFVHGSLSRRDIWEVLWSSKQLQPRYECWRMDGMSSRHTLICKMAQPHFACRIKH